jgi:predicted nuclease of predicted toxin-antitoxin system
MKILFDQGTPVPLRGFLPEHDVQTAFERGWSNLKNGDLLAIAEADGFECLVTTDKNLSYQQNLSRRKIALVVLPTTNWPKLRGITGAIAKAVADIGAGGYIEVEFPG